MLSLNESISNINFVNHKRKNHNVAILKNEGFTVWRQYN